MDLPKLVIAGMGAMALILFLKNRETSGGCCGRSSGNQPVTNTGTGSNSILKRKAELSMRCGKGDTKACEQLRRQFDDDSAIGSVTDSKE